MFHNKYRAQASSSELWKQVWKTARDEEFWWWVRRESDGVRGTRIFKYIERCLGSLSGLRTIEVGSGAGVYSLIFARRGAQVTLVDHTREALTLAQRYFEEANLPATYIHSDVLQLDSRLHGRFDVAMSFGTVEHFRYPERFLMAKVHVELVKPGGVVIISVPNRWFLPHEALKFYLQRRGEWSLAYEGAFTRRELGKLANQLELRDVEIRGSAFRTDVRRYLHILMNTRTLQRLVFKQSRVRLPVSDRPSPLDDVLGADLVLLGRK